MSLSLRLQQYPWGLGWFLWWEVSGCTASVFWDTASRICLAFFFSSNLAFSLFFMWCIYAIVLTWQQLYSIREIRFSYDWLPVDSSPHLYKATANITFNWSYVNLSTNFRDLSLTVETAPSCLKHMNYVLFAFMWSPTFPAAFLVVRFWLGQVYMWRTLNDLHILCL